MRSGSFDVEYRTQMIGRDLFRRAREAVVPFSFNRWLDDRFLRASLRNETLKTQLFRFVDTFPALRTSGQITRHLQEYLGWPLRYLPRDGIVGELLAAVTRANITRMAHGFVAATTLAEAEERILKMRRRRMAFTIDLLGEAVVAEREADEYQRRYLELIDGLADRLASAPFDPLIDCEPRVNVSVKLSSLFSQFDPIDPTGTSAVVRSRLRAILRRAMSRGAFVNVDMEHSAFKDITLRIFQEILDEEEFRHWPHAGIALQAYLRESANDLAGLARWVERRGTAVSVRLVKGAYWDSETVLATQNNWPVPVFTQKAETDAQFERLTTFLLEHHEMLRPAIASHNIRSLAHALAEAERLDLPVRRLEFQLLYGMGDPIKAALVELEQRVRIYTPFGQLVPGMAYLVRRLLENTSNTSFLRHGFIEHDPEENLLMKPITTQFPLPDRGEGQSEGPSFRNEPIADFSRADVRSAMQAALAGLRCQTYPLVIAGQPIDTGAYIDSLNPSHRDQIVGRCARAAVEHAQAAIAGARAAFPAWQETPATHRAALLRKAAASLRRRRWELAALEVAECAKQWREADADVCEAIDFCEFYAAEMLRLSDPRRRDVPGETNEYFYEPRGVAVVIAPWNFPLAILTGMTAAAIVTGNTAIMKPAEPSPVIAAKLMDAFVEAGFPLGVVNYLPGRGSEIGPTLVQHPDVALIAFTGSREVGLWINRTAAETPPGQQHIKRVIAEMGGKNAIVVDDDADLDEAIKGVVASAFGYAGQKCSACSRVVVLESIYDAFLTRLIEASRSLRVGPAEDPGCFVGPVIDGKAQARITGLIEAAKRECRLAFVGESRDEGFYIAPHIFANVPATAAIAQEEIFGPVVAVMKAGDLDEALRIANGVAYALTGGFYSRSPANIARVRQEFRVGNLYINRKITGALVDRQPFGGFKLSGIGSKAGGPDYLQQFMVPRTVTENTLRHGFAPTGELPESSRFKYSNS